MTRKRSNAFSLNPNAPLDSEQQLLLDSLIGPTNPPPAPAIRAISPLEMLIAFRKMRNNNPSTPPSGCKPNKSRKFDDEDKDNFSPTKPIRQRQPFAL